MPRFTPGELKVMRLLWEHGELKPGELQERFPEPIKNPALRSYLTTLLEKGHVTRRRVGKAYYYKAATRSRSAFRTMLGELVDAYCGGSVQALVMNIIKSERLSEEELLELKRLADGDDPTPRPAARGAGNERCSRLWSELLAGLAGASIGLVLVAKWTVRAGPGLAGACGCSRAAIRAGGSPSGDGTVVGRRAGGGALDRLRRS